MADIIGIQPEVGEMDVIRNRPHLPLSLIHALSLACREFDVKIIDARVEKDWKETLLRELRAKPLAVGISVMTGRPVMSALEVSNLVKQNSEVPVLWGGIHPTISPRETLADESVDMVVVGDGEETVLEAARRIAARRPLSGIDGLWTKAGGTIVEGGRRRPFDLDSVVHPPYHLVDVPLYLQEYRGVPSINVETSRGCRYRCRYCHHTGRSTPSDRFRALSAANALARMQRLADAHGVSGFYVVDDDFFSDRERGMTIARDIEAAVKSVRWQIQGVDVPSMLRLTDRDLSLLERSGLQRISAGAESGSEKVLRYIRKPHTPDMVIRANRRWRSYDVNVYYSFLSGFPGETAEDLRNTVDLMFRLIEENPRARVSPIYNFVPYPGTNLWNEVVSRHGFVPPRSLQEWGAYDWNHVNVPYLSEEMRSLLNAFYWPSLCMDDKFAEYGLPPWLSLCTRAYRPLARLRLKHFYAGLQIERNVAGAVSALLSKGRMGSRPWTI